MIPPPPSPSVLASLVSFAASGDADAFAELVRRFQDMATGFAFGVLGDRAAADDVAQDAFADAWRLLGQLREPAAFPGWLRRIVFKHCDRRRRSSRVGEVALDRIAAPASEARPDLAAAIAALPPAEREIVALYYFAGRSLGSTARFLDIGEKTAKSRLHRARARLRGLIDDDLPLPSRDTTFLDQVMRMIKPVDLDSTAPHGPWSCRGHDVWDVMCAALTNDVAAIRRLVARDANLYRAGYWYTQPIHFAAREGHVEAVRALLDLGADPNFRRHAGEDMVAIARYRGHDSVARMLEDARRGWRSADAPVDTGVFADHAVHDAAGADDVARLGALLDADPTLVHRHGASERLPLHAAAVAGAHAAARLLLARGADPNRPEGADAPRGKALHVAAKRGDRALVELLLAHGADPNGSIDSAGSATYAAATPELRALMYAHGGKLDCYDLIWLGEHDEVLRRIAADPHAADAGCGSAFAAACTLGKGDLVRRMLALGARVPAVVDGCRSYLWEDPALLGLLLDSGMSPDLPNWERVVPLHDLCWRDARGRARERRIEIATIFLDHGAYIEARDEDTRSTPLAWAAANDLPDMVDLLLRRGAAVEPAGDAWATPLAWATRRGHGGIVAMLTAAGATR